MVLFFVITYGQNLPIDKSEKIGVFILYIKRKEKKIELYKKYGINLIEIDNDKIGNLDDHLPKELLKFGVSLNLQKKGRAPL